MIEWNYNWKLWLKTTIENYDWKLWLKTTIENWLKTTIENDDWKLWLKVIIKYNKNRKSIALVGIMFPAWSLDREPKLYQLNYKSV